MRILYFSSRECWPPNSGARLRDYHLARQLARRASVTYVGLTYPGETPYHQPSDGLPRPEEIFERVVRIDKARAYSLVNLVRGLLGPTPVTLWNCTTPRIAAELRELGREIAFDSIQMEGVHLARYIPILRGFPGRPALVCDWHNIESELMWRYSQSVDSLPRRLYARRTAALIERAEIQLLADADTHTVASEREKKKLEAVEPRASLHVIENGVDNAYLSDAEIERASARWSANGQGCGVRQRIVFTASMDYHANADAAVHFARHVWPAVRERVSGGLCFTIVGRSPSAEVIALSKLPGVEVTGTVPDVRPYYRQALAVVAPLRVGGGTRLKILEAMAAGVPVVSTTLGAEGLNVRNGCDLLIADTPAATAEALAALAGQPALWRQLSAAGRELTARHYDWQILGARLFEIHQSARERAAARS